MTARYREHTALKDILMHYWGPTSIGKSLHTMGPANVITHRKYINGKVPIYMGSWGFATFRNMAPVNNTTHHKCIKMYCVCQDINAFIYDKRQITECDKYKYLGVIISNKKRRFKENFQYLKEKSTRACISTETNHRIRQQYLVPRCPGRRT